MSHSDFVGIAGTRARPAMRSEMVRVQLLGGFSVSVGTRIIEPKAWRQKKAATLLKVLALSPKRSIHREQIIDLLWPDLDRGSGANNLRQTILVLRKTLDPERTGLSSDFVASHSGHVALCPQGNIWVDVEAFEMAIRYARRVQSPGAYEVAVDLYAGELLPGDPYEGWVAGRREQLREAYVTCLSRLASAYEDCGSLRSAIDTLRKATVEEPGSEELHAHLMRVYALAGRRSEALRQFDVLRGTLARELGTQPSTSTRALVNEIAVGRFTSEPGLSSSASAQAAVEPGLQGLPVPRTTFVDREGELAELEHSLARSRLLTLTGTGGCGKTRLALRAATELADAYPDGVRLVELAGLSDPHLVPQAAARTLGLREEPGRSIEESIAEKLREQRVLLVIDNCEHLLAATSPFVGYLLDACPSLVILATSREPLGVREEVVFPVAPLPVPGDRWTDRDELARNPSVRLFVDRARQRLPGFSLDRGEASAVARVCRKLEGIPLALELAAARMGVLATDQIAHRLEASMDLLSGGIGATPSRQRTMRATIDWSYALLYEDERSLLCRLSVFAGGFTLEAAEAVCPGGVVAEDELLALLSALVEGSLVTAETTMKGRVRYRMLEPIRQYARERLGDTAEAEELGHRHAAYFLAFAERAEPELKGRGQVEWLERLEEDNDNLRAAMAWLLAEDEIVDAVRLAFALWVFWLIHGHQAEGRRRIEAALERGENLDDHTRARTLQVLASTHYGAGSPERMEQVSEEAATLYRSVGDDLGLAYVLSAVATARMLQDDVQGAIATFEEAILLSLQAGDRWGPSGAFGHLGSIYLGLGDFEHASRSLEEGLALSREIGNKLAETTALCGLAKAALGQGRYERAAEIYADGLRSAAEAGDKANAAYCLEGLAEFAVARGRMEYAARLFGAAEAALDAAGGTLYAYAQDRSPRERAVETLRSRMDRDALSTAWSRGSALSLSEAIEYALTGSERAIRPHVPDDPVVGQPLTPRQQEIAALVARGMTNRQVASELSVSEHTVANHVAKILDRLGFASRAQIAAWVSQRTP